MTLRESRNSRAVCFRRTKSRACSLQRTRVAGDSAVFCATGITHIALLPGVKLIGKTAITHSILMRARSQTVRYIRAVHNLERKTIHLRSDRADHKI